MWCTAAQSWLTTDSASAMGSGVARSRSVSMTHLSVGPGMNSSAMNQAPDLGSRCRSYTCGMLR